MKIKTSFSLFALLMLIPDIPAQELPAWQDPEIVQINRELPRATMFSFDRSELAMNGEKEDSENFLSLNGVWKFKYFESPADHNPLGSYRRSSSLGSDFSMVERTRLLILEQ